MAVLLAGAEERTVALATGPLSDRLARRLALGVALGGSVAFSSLGGRLAGALKTAGFDAVVLSGEAAGPSVIIIDDEDVRVEDGIRFWGLDVPSVETALSDEYGEGFAPLVVGPAAERGLVHATVSHDGHYAGGGGIDVTFGAMKLKGILVRDRLGLPGRCTGCTMNCAVRRAVEMGRANLLGLDARVLLAAGLGGGEAGDAEAPMPPGGLARRRGPGVADLLGTCHRVFRGARVPYCKGRSRRRWVW